MLQSFHESSRVQEPQPQRQTLTAEHNLFLMKYLYVQSHTRNKITLLYIPYDINKHMNRLSNINCNTCMIKYVTQSCDCNVITARRDPTTAGLTCICRPGREYQQQATHMSLCQELHTSMFYHGHSPTAVSSWPNWQLQRLEAPPPTTTAAPSHNKPGVRF